MDEKWSMWKPGFEIIAGQYANPVPRRAKEPQE
jgi:hypothetical protein